jgi:FkbH-like protein
MVFLDDSPVERELVKSQIPDVTVIEFPKDTAALPELMKAVFEEHFYALKLTDEDKNKTEAYQVEALRKEEQRAAISIDDFIKSLEIKLDIHEMKNEEVSRVAQLTQKTNQFNLTTRRYTEGEITAFAESQNHSVITASVSDKYGEYGIVAVVILKYDDAIAEIDLLLMSCRVMGRKIEESVMQWVEDYIIAKGIDTINTCYIKTQKNVPAEFFFDGVGYKLLGQSDEPFTKKYHKELA